jgi:hypothetical protein
LKDHAWFGLGNQRAVNSDFLVTIGTLCGELREMGGRAGCGRLLFGWHAGCFDRERVGCLEIVPAFANSHSSPFAILHSRSECF